MAYEHFYTLFDHAFIILSLTGSILSILLLINYSRSKQVWAYFLITASFYMNLIPNILSIPLAARFGGSELVPFPSHLDIMWLSSYILFGLGIFIYWVNVQKSIGIKRMGKWMLIIFSVSVISLLMAKPVLSYYNAFKDPAYDSLYVALPFFSAIVCLPLMYLFKGGKLSEAWFYFALGGLFNMVHETVWIIELESNVHLLSNVLRMVGYGFLLTGMVMMLEPTAKASR